MNIERYKMLLNKLDLNNYILLHDAALHAYNASNNVFCNPFDILIDKEDFNRLKEELDVEEETNKYFSSIIGDVKFRFWNNIAGYNYKTIPKKELKGNTLPEPNLLLDEILDECPELYLLLEQRARFASIVYFDEMSDEEINLFRRYVRST